MVMYYSALEDLVDNKPFGLESLHYAECEIGTRVASLRVIMNGCDAMAMTISIS